MDIPTFKAQCGNCGCSFEHPSLGDHVYGEMILCTADGKHFAWASAFATFPQRIRALMRALPAGSYWRAVAALADPISSQRLTAELHCPHCSSTNIASWAGDRIGSANVQAASFFQAEALSSEALELRIAQGAGDRGGI